jgi:H+/Cl- antiporter ClcA
MEMIDTRNDRSASLLDNQADNTRGSSFLSQSSSSSSSSSTYPMSNRFNTSAVIANSTASSKSDRYASILSKRSIKHSSTSSSKSKKQPYDEAQSGNLWLDAALDAKFQRQKRTGSWVSRTWHFLQTFTLIIFIGMFGSLWTVGLDYLMDLLNHVRESISCVSGSSNHTPCLENVCQCANRINGSIIVNGNNTNSRSDPGNDLLHWLAYFGWSCALLVSGFLVSNLVSLTAVGSGIPRMKSVLSGTHIHHFLSIRTLLAKSVGLLLVFSSGLPIGREGPYVHLSCCIAILLMRTPVYRRYLTSSARRIDMLTVGLSTGVSAAFGAPFGGVVFAVEVVSQYFYVPNLPRMFLAALSGTFIVKMLRDGNDATAFVALFKTSFTSESTILTAKALGMILVVGIISGILSGIFVRLVSKIVQMRRRYAPNPTYNFKNYLLLFCAVATIISITNSLVTRIFWNVLPAVRTQRSLIDTLFLPGNVLGQFTWHIGALLLVNFFLTALCITLPIPTGLFIPVLVIGALTGRFLSGIVCTDCLSIYGYEPGVYAVVGAAAFAAGTTRAISTAVIVTEVTGQPHLLLPISLGVIVAYFVANRISKPAYDSLIEANHFPQLPKLSYKLGNSPAQACMRPITPSQCLRPDDTIKDAYNLLLRGTREVGSFGKSDESSSDGGSGTRVYNGSRSGRRASLRSNIVVGISIPVIRSNENMVLLGEVQTATLIKLIRGYLGKETSNNDLRTMNERLASHREHVLGGDQIDRMRTAMESFDNGGGVTGALNTLVSAEEEREGMNASNFMGLDSTSSSTLNVLNTQLPFCVEDGILSSTFSQRSDVERQFGVGKVLVIEPVRFFYLSILFFFVVS